MRVDVSWICSRISFMPEIEFLHCLRAFFAGSERRRIRWPTAKRSPTSRSWPLPCSRPKHWSGESRRTVFFRGGRVKIQFARRTLCCADRRRSALRRRRRCPADEGSQLVDGEFHRIGDAPNLLRYRRLDCEVRFREVPPPVSSVAEPRPGSTVVGARFRSLALRLFGAPARVAEVHQVPSGTIADGRA